MKKITLCMTLLALLIPITVVQAANLELSMSQEKQDQLKGWNIYQLAYDKDNPPDGQFIMANYDRKLTWEAFSEANVLTPILEREWGCKVLPYPGYEDTYWEVTINIYVPGIDPALNQKVFFVVTATGLNDTESDPSNVASVAINWPGKPGTPAVSNIINIPANSEQKETNVVDISDDHNTPSNRLKIKLVP
jgi:hypothetical protein